MKKIFLILILLMILCLVTIICVSCDEQYADKEKIAYKVGMQFHNKDCDVISLASTNEVEKGTIGDFSYLGYFPCKKCNPLIASNAFETIAPKTILSGWVCGVIIFAIIFIIGYIKQSYNLKFSAFTVSSILISIVSIPWAYNLFLVIFIALCSIFIFQYHSKKLLKQEKDLKPFIDKIEMLINDFPETNYCINNIKTNIKDKIKELYEEDSSKIEKINPIAWVINKYISETSNYLVSNCYNNKLLETEETKLMLSFYRFCLDKALKLNIIDHKKYTKFKSKFINA